MKAEVISIGSELLLAGVPETNSIFLVQELAKLGIEVRWKTVVGDNASDMAEALKRAIQRSSVVITTGGLGPTLDDFTKKVVAKITHRRLILKENLLQELREKYAERKRLTGKLPAKMPKGYERQALLPTGVQVLKNPAGTAPGFVMQTESSYLVVLPGVPYEMKQIFRESVRGILEKLSRRSRPFSSLMVRTFGLPESRVNELLRDLMEPPTGLKIGMMARSTGIDIYAVARRAFGTGVDTIAELRQAIRKRLGDAIYSENGRDMEEVVGIALKEKGYKLSVAESCTGGLIGHRLTSIPGSSHYFERGVICYSNQSKMEILQVPQELLERHGAVSSQTASALAEGVKRLSKSDLGLGITGIAGPGGATPEKPVGLVYVALAHRGETRCEARQFRGDRQHLKLTFSQAALDLVRRYLLCS